MSYPTFKSRLEGNSYFDANEIKEIAKLLDIKGSEISDYFFVEKFQKDGKNISTEQKIEESEEQEEEPEQSE